MILLAKYGRDRCHVCGRRATMLSDYEKGGCWLGLTETVTHVPLCEEHGWGRKPPPGVKFPKCGAYYPAGNAKEKAAAVARAIENVYGPEKQRQLTLL